MERCKDKSQFFPHRRCHFVIFYPTHCFLVPTTTNLIPSYPTYVSSAKMHTSSFFRSMSITMNRRTDAMSQQLYFYLLKRRRDLVNMGILWIRIMQVADVAIMKVLPIHIVIIIITMDKGINIRRQNFSLLKIQSLSQPRLSSPLLTGYGSIEIEFHLQSFLLVYYFGIPYQKSVTLFLECLFLISFDKMRWWFTIYELNYSYPLVFDMSERRS